MITWSRSFFHSPASYLMELVVSMHDYVILFLLRTFIVVIWNILYSLYARSFSLSFFENHQLESVWTVLPFVILLFIVGPSLSSLYMLDTCFFCGLSLSIVGHQWYWRYFFKDLNNIIFDSYIAPSERSYLRLIDVDNRVLIPNILPVRFIVSSADVIHSWTIPSFGVKIDAIPGRINQFCFSSKHSGVYFGQCSEICGANHSFMPIVIESVPFNQFVRSI